MGPPLGIRDWGLGVKSKVFFPGEASRLVPSPQAGNVFKEALPLVKLVEAEPPRMGSQPPGS